MENHKYTYEVSYPLSDTKGLLEQFVTFFKKAHEMSKKNEWKSYLISMAMSLVYYEGERLCYYYAAPNTRHYSGPPRR
ncbi:MAG: hypothetical protein GY816_11040 [Cytophagales bacterium]|nr:hypothetical protein [Cytophagales bacterium]